VADAFLHAQQPHAALAFRIESLTVILDGEQDAAGLLLDGHPGHAGFGVLDAVVQGFLDDPVDAGLVLLGKILRDSFCRHLHTQASPLRDFARLPLQRRNQAQVVQHGGPEQQRHVPHYADRVLDHLLDLVHLGVETIGFAATDLSRKVGQFDADARERLSHFVVQLAGDRAPLIFLRLDQARRELLELRPGCGDFLIARRCLSFQAQDLAHTEGSQQEAHADGKADGDDQALAELGKGPEHLFAAGIQLGFVDAGDLIGDMQHRRAPREDFIAQKSVALSAPLGRVPKQDRLEHLPVEDELLGQAVKRAGFLGVQQGLIFLERGIHVAPGLQQAEPVAFRLLAFRLEQVIPHVGAGEVEIRPDPLQHPRPREKILANLVIAALNLTQGLDAIGSREAHQEQQAAESDQENEAAGDSPGSGRSGRLMRGFVHTASPRHASAPDLVRTRLMPW
jgi:hypothetical protein